MTSPQVSICIPTYCQLDYLRETLRSVEIQSYKDYELIVSDDTPDLLVKELVLSYDFGHRLRYYRNSPALGSPENWNQAISYAKGKYIKILHHDDRFQDSESLDTFVSLLDDNPNADLAFSVSTAENIVDGYMHTHCPSKEQVHHLSIMPESLFFYNVIGAPSAVIYRNKFNIKFDQQLKWLVDIEFYIQFLLKNNQFVYTPEVLIATAANAPHQVTSFCQSDACVDLCEHFYLYQKIAVKIKSHPSTQSIWFRLFEKYSVYSPESAVKKGVNCFSQVDDFPFFEAYKKNSLKRTPFRMYARLPIFFKKVIRFLLKKVRLV
ncbi:MAG: glycosyltransferase [Mariprofundaceae bacterium]|nr:glycosyltransferase [Mariprofundaceae bacterium]